MPQNQFILKQGFSKELELFPHIKEFCLKKNNTIQLGSFEMSRCESLRIYFVIDGKFEWVINKKNQISYPGDTVVVLPGQEIGGAKGYLEIGSLFWLHLQVEKIAPNGMMTLGKWSHLTTSECLTIGKILSLNNLSVMKVKEMPGILQEMRLEIMNQEIGYITRVNQILDLLIITIGRESTRQTNSQRDFPKTFTKLEQTLRQNLAHQWSVEEMAAMVGLGSTAFTERVKSYTGFSPLQYLINVRISEAIKLLKRQNVNLTEIALETGFYSSQHFSTTFKKLTGHTPGGFRKNNIYKEL